MMKKLAITAAVLATFSLGAHAQTAQPAPVNDRPAAAVGQQAPQAQRDRLPLNSPGYASIPAAERTAANLEDADVYTADGDEIGDVSDLLVDNNGQVTHVVVNVGGFLGMGTHTVALPLDQVDVQWNQDRDDARVYVSMTKDQLKALPEHKK